MKNLDIIREKIESAFDAGYSSCYDLKQNIVDEILSELLDQKSCIFDGLQLTTTDIENALNSASIPVLIKTLILNDQRCWLSGGQILCNLNRVDYIYSPKEHSTSAYDYDIYIDKSELNNPRIKALYLDKHTLTSKDDYSTSALCNKNKSNITQVHRKVIDNTVLNIIVGDFDSPSDFYNDFDFRFLQVAAQYNYGFKVTASNEAISDLSTGYIMPTKSLESIISRFGNMPAKQRKRFITKLKNRIEKYTRRGMRLKFNNNLIVQIENALIKDAICKTSVKGKISKTYTMPLTPAVKQSTKDSFEFFDFKFDIT